MHFFVDTSALNKRYLPEAGSAWVRSWITADKNLRNAAYGEGFAVDDPNTHLQ